jgi:hypothetical protein
VILRCTRPPYAYARAKAISEASGGVLLGCHDWLPFLLASCAVSSVSGGSITNAYFARNVIAKELDSHQEHAWHRVRSLLAFLARRDAGLPEQVEDHQALQRMAELLIKVSSRRAAA